MTKYLKITLLILAFSFFAYTEYDKMFGGKTDAISVMAENKADSVVMIVNDITKPNSKHASGMGTGFFISDNLIVTNHHVVENTDKLYVKGKRNPKFYDAEVIASDKFSDLALIRVKDWNDYKGTNPHDPLVFASSRNLTLGSRVWSIGHPWGLTWSISEGVISSLSRRIDGNINYLLQTDTRIFQGNSGGPLLNDNGDVVGVNSRMVANTGGSFGFAIPSDLAVKVIDNLKNDGHVKWALIGIKMGSSQDKKYVAVMSVTPGSAAEKAGVLLGDVLLRVNTSKTPPDGIRIDDPDSILDEMAIINPGDRVKLTIQRNGKVIMLYAEPDGKTSDDLSAMLDKTPGK